MDAGLRCPVLAMKLLPCPAPMKVGIIAGALQVKICQHVFYGIGKFLLSSVITGGISNVMASSSGILCYNVNISRSNWMESDRCESGLHLSGCIISQHWYCRI